jgi:hypothetical protein
MGEKARELSWARAELRKAEKAAWGAAIDDPQGFLRWAVVTAKARVAKIEGEMGAAATDNDPT